MNFLSLRVFCFVYMVFSVAPLAWAQGPKLYGLDWDRITVCPASMADETPPDFMGDDCKSVTPQEIDPQNTLIWVRTFVTLDTDRGTSGEPLSLYISGKMSSEVYLNGQFVGRNGMPGDSAASEIAGVMDAQFYPPQDLFNVGDNEVVLRASSHHGFITLAWPVHGIVIGPAGVYANGSLPQYIPALLMLGLFVMGALYFGTMGVISTPRVRFCILSSICLFAAAQLVAEALRGLWPYLYPVHDIRLLSIALFSSGFGLSVAFHIFRIYAANVALKVVAGLAALCTLALIYMPGFDYKALVGMTLPLLAAMIASARWGFMGRRRAFLYFAIVFVFVAAIFAFRGLFLDTLFFFLVAFFLLLIFIEQAITLAEEARQRRVEEARANQLDLALADAQERGTASEINIKSAGKMERIATSEILHCQSADGYAEIILVDGRTVLYAATLNDMESELPVTFLRVHRSHLINVKFVEALSRDRSGTGTLTLAGGVQVPVSRRIMPKVRQALA
ncbi:LytR/AlgR family response regulator transcription factor [Kordiimonas aquimaris]|uniref:LytR/AlgR family response regulator transcription factor n=1 Tax=Kordiimonas aquimaris TaxID=707591 RepID=UPI0021D0BBA7|nr:LytTR family DNA-binding domain-containing protein [Kordiimonas aquimaris]